MKKIAKFIQAENKPLDDFKKILKSEVQKIFPKSFVSVGGWDNFVSLKFTLGKNESEYELGHFVNDPLYIILTMHFKENLKGSIELLNGSRIKVPPKSDSIYAWDYVNIGWKDKSGSSDSLLQHVVNYFKKVRQIVNKNKHLLPKQLQNK